ncbi:MAG TPA: pyridoxine 5'-phosphate synthase [Candidatus Aminicenantes bacterium]|nr:pyridoxine 5'-phosphate synthase [Acidobacteriota bacterium]HOI45389.1 pyridoxine 5'-phosphate synthase [Candidatus Aminicenantes bacterium]
MKLAVNIDHFATLREARKGTEPEPALVALLAEQAGAEGIVCHLRGDRRHIQDRDLEILRKVIKTKLNLEMAASEEMKKIALKTKPDVASLVPELPDELTTEGGLDVLSHRNSLGPFIRRLRSGGIRVSIFIDPSPDQIGAARDLGVDLIEINTGKYAELKAGKARDRALAEVREAAEFGFQQGLEIHAGHGLDYRNVLPVAAIPQISEMSIGFAIVARAAVVGIAPAVREMRLLLEKGRGLA